MVPKTPLVSRHLLFLILILILVVAIPLHFYINSELENSRYRDAEALQKYAQKVANKIYRFSNGSGSEFYFPRSRIFQAGLYGMGDEEIFSLLERPAADPTEQVTREADRLYLKYPLKANVFRGAYLVVSKQLNYSRLIVNVLVILMVVTLLVLLATFSIIRQSAEPYRRLNRYLENFIKDAMHEMKTPIGVILLNLDGLGSLYENNTMILRAKSALKNMIVVYEDLEFFVKTKRVHHPKQQIDFSLFCHERIAFFSDLLRAKDIKVTADITENIPLHFSRLELSRIIDNTLSNAVKYSKNATEITLSLHEEAYRIVLRICDQGQGIADSARIFERYYRGDKISGGFGIGLNIVKKICEQHHVEISVESEVGKGSCFTYRFQKEEKKSLV